MRDTEIGVDVLRLKNIAVTTKLVQEFIKKEVERSKRNGVALAFSGGKDSTAVACLCAASIGPEKVLAIYMPTENSKSVHREHALWVAKWLGVRLEVIDITPVLKALGAWGLLPEMHGDILSAKAKAEKEIGGDSVIYRAASTGHDLVARGAAFGGSQHRLRAVYVSMFADLENLLMVGTGNYSEFSLGSSILFGCDELAEIMPIRPFYRTQVKQLLEHFGVLREIIDKPSDPDVIMSIDSIDQMFGPSEQNDLILYGLEHGITKQSLEKQFGIEAVRRVTDLVETASKYKRGLPHIPKVQF